MPTLLNQRTTFSSFREEKIMSTLSPALNVLVTGVRKAGRRIIRDFNEIENLQVSGKSVKEFMTKTKEKSFKTLFEYLQTARPRYSYLLTGGRRTEGEDISNTFILNELDGEVNFMHGIPMFSISAALLRDGEITAGVIYNPVSDELFYAEKGSGAFVMTASGDKRLRVSQRNDMKDALIGVDFAFQNKQEITECQAKLVSLIEHTAGIRRLGCVSLEMAYTAMGKFDGCFCNFADITQTATGFILMKEAGGHIRDNFGKAKSSDCLASGGIIAVSDNLDTLLTKALKDGSVKTGS